MAAALVLCGNKRSFFEEDVLPSSLDRSKRLRCSSYSILPQHVNPLRRPRLAEETEPERLVKRAKVTGHENPMSNNLNSAAEWVEVFVREMSSATSIDDAKARAAKMLEPFEHGIRSRAAAESEAEAAKKEEENVVLKQEIQELTNNNGILKRAVNIQNEHLKVLEGRNQECEHLKQIVNQCQGQLSKLEYDKYVLEQHLKQALQCNTSMPLNYHTHAF